MHGQQHALPATPALMYIIVSVLTIYMVICMADAPCKHFVKKGLIVETNF